MHFFFAYEGKDNVVPRSVQADARAAPYVHFLPSYLSQQYGAVNLPFNEDLFFGKIDFEPSGDDRLELSVQYRDETQIDNIGGQNAADHGSIRPIKTNVAACVGSTVLMLGSMS